MSDSADDDLAPTQNSTEALNEQAVLPQVRSAVAVVIIVLVGL